MLRRSRGWQRAKRAPEETIPASAAAGVRESIAAAQP